MTQFKICLLGAYAVGKTSLVARFTRGIFSDKYLATLGVKIDRRLMRFGETVYRLIVWDMAGEDEFEKVNLSYLVGASGYLLVMDGTRRATFDQAKILEHRVREKVGALPFVVLVNKADIDASWEIGAADIADLTRQRWCVQRTSAKTGEGVEEAFETLVAEILRKREAPRAESAS